MDKREAGIKIKEHDIKLCCLQDRQFREIESRTIKDIMQRVTMKNKKLE